MQVSQREVLFTHTQVMGDELLQILESQRQLEKKFDHLTSPEGGGLSLREEAHSLSTATHGGDNFYLQALSAKGWSPKGTRGRELYLWSNRWDWKLGLWAPLAQGPSSPFSQRLVSQGEEVEKHSTCVATGGIGTWTLGPT